VVWQGGKLGKKEGSLKNNTRKLEGLLYDLSVVRASSSSSSSSTMSQGAADDDGDKAQ
jgi:hypothetical protein